MHSYPHNFINRSREIKLLQLHAGRVPSKSKAIVVTGPRGVGKSALTDRFLSVTPRLGLKARILDAGGQKTSDAAIIRSLAEDSDALAAKTPALPDLESFLRTLPTKEIAARYNSALLAELGEVNQLKILRPAAMAIGRRMGVGSFSSRKIYESQSAEVALILYSYLQHVAATVKPVFAVENAHLADEVSLEMLVQVCSDVPGLLLILEHTQHTEPAIDAGNLANFFKRGAVDTAIEEIRPLSFEDFMSLIDAQPGSRRRLMERAYVELNGNLRSLLDLQVQLIEERHEVTVGSSRFLRPTLARVEDLKPADQFLLVALVTHFGEVELDLLARFSRMDRSRDLLLSVENGMARLEEAGLVNRASTNLRVAHDTVTEEVENSDVLERYKLLAMECWRDTYGSLLRDGDFELLGRSAVVSRLFSFIGRTQPHMLLGHLEEIQKTAKNSLTPETALAHLNRLRTSLQEFDVSRPGLRREVSIALAESYYEATLFENAYDILAEIQPANLRVKIFRCAILNRLGQHHAVLRLAAETAETTTVTSAQALLHTVAMASYMSLGHEADAESELEKALAAAGDSDDHIQGVVRRSCVIASGYRRSIALLEAAVAAFQRAEEPEEEGKARVNLGMQLARLGSMARARRELHAAEIQLQSNPFTRQHVLNNLATIDLLTRSADQSTLSRLRAALPTCRYAFDKLVVLSNTLATQATLGLPARHTFEELLETLARRNPPDKRLHRSIYYNCAVFLRDAERDSARSEDYMEQAKAVQVPRTSYWDFRLRGGPISGTLAKWVSGTAYHVGFLSFWHFIPPKILDQLEGGDQGFPRN